ncbi:1777_t:CDS:2 [Ambispora leptoticha]|uniref:1777_t:CDS:1 n=1 Tax=Ambispora leptoticha TaxID=144679 RepID=A0A9N9A0B4_9GLOM|nr:1777_t:CDS:2 [Ambispora leptoticha]
MVSNVNPSQSKPKLIEEEIKDGAKSKKDHDSIRAEIQNPLATPIPLQASFGLGRNPVRNKTSTISNASTPISLPSGIGW